MKDLFDECEFGNLHLNSRIIRTGTWEREIENGGFLETSVFERYEKIASSGVIVKCLSWTLETVLQSIATILTIKAS